MQAALYIKTEPQTKAELQKLAKQLGISLTVLVNRLLQDVIKTKSIPDTLLPEIPNARTRTILKKAEANRKAGKGSPMSTDDQKLIKKDSQKYRHIDTMEQWFHEQGI